LTLLLILLGVVLCRQGSWTPEGASSLRSLIASPLEEPGTDALSSTPKVSHSAPNSIGNPSDTVALVLISLVVLLPAAKLGGDLFERMGQPAVLGELVFGVLLGSLPLLGFQGLNYLRGNEVVRMLAEIGVIFLLFEVGLGSNIKQMLEVGLSSFMVALLG